MTGTVLEHNLKTVARRVYKLRLLRRQVLCWLVLLVPAICCVAMLPQLRGVISTSMLVLLGITLIGTRLARWKLTPPTAREVARLVEKERPELNDAVLTAVEVSERQQQAGRPSVLNSVVIDEANQLARQGDWKSVVPGWQMAAWSTFSMLAFCFLATGVVMASRWELSGQPAVLPASEEPGMEQVTDPATIVVEPGDTEVERGASLTVVARFGSSVPTDAVLQLNTESDSRLIPLESTVDHGVFAGRVNHVDVDGSYRVLFGNASADMETLTNFAVETSSAEGGSSAEYSVTTYVRPRLEQLDARITPPEYTKREATLIEDTLRVTAVEGSNVELTLRLNKPVTVAELQTSSGESIPLTANETAPEVVSATVEAIEDRSYHVYLRDAAGRTPAVEDTVHLKVTRNSRPNIKVTFPGRDSSVSPLQEFHIEAEAKDDFGFTNFGVTWSLSGSETQEVSLGQQSPPAAADADNPLQLSMRHAINLEELNAVPDQLLSYSFFVEDIASDGSVRRSYSDMMFAEVRRYEEIFRESQQQSGQSQQQQQNQQGNMAEQLLKLQRQIMIATWNVNRAFHDRRSFDSAADRARRDTDVIAQSQQAAIEQLEEAKEQLTDDPEMLTLAESAGLEMQKAAESLQSFAVDLSDAEIQAALNAEQAAIAALMRMRTKEHQVRRGQQQGQGQGSNSASQQQLRQLELDNDRQRYETERQAQQQQQQQRTAEQQEQLQVLNRLRELARRQQMVNERLKQLESELRAAETDEEKEEIARELKRLRDEQQELLRDVDELRQTMDQQPTEQQQENQAAREQVEQARDQVQQASRALDAGNLSEAISEGTRAERQFDELQEQFREQTSSRFSEAMRDLREQTRQIMDRQDDIARALAGEQTEGAGQTGSESEGRQRPSLRNDRETQQREELETKVAQQRDQLERVLEQAREMVEQAEESEPLLSRRLYDTVRETREKNPAEALEATEMLVSRGLYQQGQQAEQVARDGLEDLRDGIERAAEAVLGSEAESLRRASQEIEDLAEQLSSEIAEATGTATPARVGEDFRPPTPMDDGAGYDNESRADLGQRLSAPPRPGEQAQGTGSRQDSPNTAPRDSDSEGRPSERQQRDREQRDRQQGQQSSGRNRPANTQNEDANQQGPPQPGQGDSSRSSSQPSQQGQNGEGGQNGQNGQEGRQQGSQSQGGQAQTGQSQQQDGQSERGGGQTPGRNFLMNGGREGNNGGRGINQGRPLTGDDYRGWSNRMREVEETLDDPELRNRVARVRDRARAIRAEFRRHGTEPKWDLVQSQLLDEMVDLQKRIQEELARLDSGRSMVPIDREPVPEEFDELVRRYYELLGRSDLESR